MFNGYPEEIIEEVRISNDIVDVVSEYVKLDKKGQYYFGLCPFHKEKSPSFSVTPSKQIYYCYGCEKGGNVINFIMGIENLDFIEAIRLLADRARIQLPEGDGEEEKEKGILRKEIIKINTESARFFYANLNGPDGEKARNYLAGRKINEHSIRRFGLGYSLEGWDELYKHLVHKGFKEEHIKKSGLVLLNKNGGLYDRFRGRLMFPIFDIRGNVIGFGGRVLDSSLPKYMNSPETLVYNKSKNLYALNLAKNANEKRIIVVEGYLDVISLHQRGILNVVASLGTALTESQGRILKKYAEEIIISYDADTAGQAATIRGLELLNDIGCKVKVLVIPDGKDPDEFIKKNGTEEFRKLVKNPLSLVEYKIKVLKKQISLESVDGKIEFLNKIADVLTKIDNLVEREMHIKSISKEYEISEDSLRAEIVKRIRPKTKFKTSAANIKNFAKKNGQNDSAGLKDKLNSDELMILALLCVDNRTYKIVKDRLSIEDFRVENRDIAKVIFERLDQNKTVVAAELMNIIKGNNTDYFARVINEVSNCEDTEKAVIEKIRSLKLSQVEIRKQEILELLKNEGNLEKGDVEKLKVELNSLVMKRKMI